VLIQSDVTNIPEFFLRNPDWHVAFDVDPVQAQATRHKFYDMAAAEKALVIGFHFPFPAIGYVEKDGAGYRLIPAAWNRQSDPFRSVRYGGSARHGRARHGFHRDAYRRRETARGPGLHAVRLIGDAHDLHVLTHRHVPEGAVGPDQGQLADDRKIDARIRRLSPADMRRSSWQVAGRLAGSLPSEKAGRLSRTRPPDKVTQQT